MPGHSGVPVCVRVGMFRSPDSMMSMQQCATKEDQAIIFGFVHNN